MTALEVIDVLAQVLLIRGAPKYVRSDNGPEFSVRGEAVLKMREGLSQSSNRAWLQTSLNCGDQESSWETSGAKGAA